jgi:YD repeat-containing protein
MESPEVVATRYGALVTDVWDAGDLAPGLYHGTPSTTLVDGLGRTVRTVERNRSPGSAGMQTFATDLEYNSLGAVTRMQRGLLGGDDRWADFASGESVEKLQRYDTLGRRIRNLDPDAGEYRYTYDPIDRLVATQDARGTLNRYWYDRGGRLVAEDLGGEVEYDTTGWTTAGGSVDETCTGNPARVGYCFDLLCGFDEEFDAPAEAWVNDLPTESLPCDSLFFGVQGPLAGRPSWTRDRAGTVVLGYDPHGWAIWSGRQIALDVTTGYFSQSTFDEGQRLTRETNPDLSFFDYHWRRSWRSAGARSRSA